MTTPHRRLDTSTRRNRRIAAAAGLVLVAAVVTATLVRGSNDDPDRATTSAGAATSTPGAEGTDSASSNSGPSATGTVGADDADGKTDPADDAILTPTELEPFLLRGADLPAGWRTLDAASGATQTLMGRCLQDAITPTVPQVLKTVSFRSGSNGPVLTASIRDFTTTAQSERAMTEVRKDVLTCANGNGKPALKTLTLTSRADASIAVTFTITQDGSSARGEVLVARIGARSATLALIGLTERDLELGRDALRTMIARLD